MKINVKDLSTMALYVALAVVLDYVVEMIPFLHMPSGGSVNLSLIPVFMASYQLGWKKGGAVGLLWWLMSTILGLNKYYLNPMQYALDYIIPVAICGVSSIFPKIGKISNVYIGMTITMFLRFSAQVISGAYYWPSNDVAGSLPAWIYSLSYNSGFNLVTLVVAAILVPLLIDRLLKSNKMTFIGIK